MRKKSICANGKIRGEEREVQEKDTEDNRNCVCTAVLDVGRPGMTGS